MTEIRPTRLQRFPVAWFTVVMGMAGLTLAWQRAEQLFSLPLKPSLLFLLMTAAVFSALLFCYLIKALNYPAQVKAELTHPIKVSFFPSISISFILLGTTLLSYSHLASLIAWCLGTTLHLTFTLYILSNWIHNTQLDIVHLSPIWFIPIVGNILVPMAGVHHAPLEVSWFFFSIGLVLGLVLLTLILFRLFFYNPLPDKLSPTLFIFIAPPAVSFIAYFQLTEELNDFSRILYYLALFLGLLLLTQIARFLKLPFFLSSWAYSFPIATLTIATLIIYEVLQQAFFKSLGILLLGSLTILILFLLAKTVQALANRSLSIEDE